MAGIAGDTGNKNVSEMIAGMRYMNRYSLKKADEKLISSGNIGLGIICRQNSSECCVLREESKTGVIDGFVYTDRDKKEVNKKIITGILQAPENILPSLNGSFLIAATDGKKLIVATDKLATRPCFYTIQDGRMIFGSQIKSILPVLDRKSINIEGIGDLLAFEFLLNERTLVKEICAIPPATFIEWENGKLKKKQYWHFNFRCVKSDALYSSKLLSSYEESVDNVLKTMDNSQKIGIFLSGGLDSRLLFGVLVRKQVDFLTITYDTNPPGGINPAISKTISERFGIENIAVEFPHDIASSPELIKESVWITDGLTPWHFFYNMNFDLNHLHRHVDVIINNPRQGELFGEDLSINELTSPLEPLEILRNNFRTFRSPVPESIVEGLLYGKYSVRKEIEQEISKSRRESNYEILLDVLYNNYYPNFYRTNLLTSLVELKNIFSGVELLNQIAGLPLNMRMKRMPLIRKIPMYPVSPLKLELLRLIDMGLEKIPYERTGAAPADGMHMHFIKYAKKSFFKDKNIYDFSRLLREEKLKRYIYANVDFLASRELIDSDIAYDILDRHMRGKADFGRLLGSLTTAGLYIEKAFG